MGAAVANRVVVAFIASQGYYGSMGLYSMHTEREHAESVQPYYGMLSYGVGCLQRCCSLPCLLPDGVVSSKEGMGRAHTVCTPCIP